MYRAKRSKKKDKKIRNYLNRLKELGVETGYLEDKIQEGRSFTELQKVREWNWHRPHQVGTKFKHQPLLQILYLYRRKYVDENLPLLNSILYLVDIV